ncbi:MAG: prolipoprotein diacylglyceryl transferase [Myxococcota bacterium]
MRPTLLEFELPIVGAVVFPAYLTLLMIGFLAAIYMVRRQAERDGLPGHTMVDIGIVVLVLGILGARILAVLTDGKLMDFVHLCTDPTLVEATDRLVDRCATDAQCGYHYLCNAATNTCYPPRDCLAALKFWQGGLTYYGGFMLAVPGGIWFVRRKGLDPRQVADLAAPAVMLGLFFGRIGCFCNGCCYGAETDALTGLIFPSRPHAAVHPTQLYEAASALGLFAVLHFVVRPRKRGHGEVFAWLLTLYGVWRVAIEVLRADPRGSFGPLSTSQVISLPLIALGVWLIVRIRRSPRTVPTE